MLDDLLYFIEQVDKLNDKCPEKYKTIAQIITFPVSVTGLIIALVSGYVMLTGMYINYIVK